MKIFVQNILILKDKMTKVHKQVWPWEVAVIEAQFGGGNVQLKDLVEHEISGLPDAQSEYQRLFLNYGTDGGQGGTNIPFVQQAYGARGVGLKALEKAIKASATKPRAKKKATAKKPKPPPVAEDGPGEGDPLPMV